MNLYISCLIKCHSLKQTNDYLLTSDEQNVSYKENIANMFRTPTISDFSKMFHTPKINLEKCFVPQKFFLENVSYP